MAISSKLVTESESEDISDEEDSSFNEDMEALRRACMLTGTNPNQIEDFTAPTTTTTAPATSTTSISDSEEEGSSEIDDVELVKKIQQRFNLSSSSPNDNNTEPIFLKPLKCLPPAGLSDDDYSDVEDDFETLRSIERRFANYVPTVLEKNTQSISNEPEVVQGTSTILEQETPYILPLNRKDAYSLGEDFPGSEQACNSSLLPRSFNDTGPWDQPFGSTDWHQPETSKSPKLSSKYSSFTHPKSAHSFVDAIKKNRSFQKLIRNKLIQIEARIEENRKLKERVKLLKDFQVSCKISAGRAASLKKDARIKLISACKCRDSPTLEVNDKKVPALCFGPVENSHVANYRMVMRKLPLSLRRERWSDEERESLGKGIKQQFQEMLLQKSLELYSDPKISSGDSNTFDDIIASIKDFDIPPEKVRSFLPKVDWNQLALINVEGHSGAECEARWLNHEDPLINHNPWTKVEDKNLLFILEKQGIHNWIDISTKMRTHRTPFQCFVRYQRSLNSNIMKRNWIEDDDAQLRSAVEAFGENNWQLVASIMEGRTGAQCSNRWTKTLNPVRKRMGRWTVEEDRYLKVAVMLFGPKTWNKIEQFVPGRTQVQCRERWLNVLDPSMNLGQWTEEEDSRLKSAISKHGHCWSKVAEAVPSRTDNQCRRRWKVLLPHEVPMLQAARRVRKLALISNFVGREAERPELGPSDFLPLPGTSALTESENSYNRQKEKRRGRPSSKNQKDTTFLGDAVSKKRNARRRGPSSRRCTELSTILNVETFDGNNNTTSKKKRKDKPRPEKKKSTEAELSDHQEVPLSPESLAILEVINSGADEILADNTTTSKKKIECKPRGKRTKYTEPLLSDQELPSSPRPVTLKTKNGYDCRDVYFEEDTTSKKKRKGKPRQEKNKSTEPELSDLQEVPLSPGSLAILEVINGGADEILADNNTTSKKIKECKPRGKRKKDTEPQLSYQELPSSPKSLSSSFDPLTLPRITNSNNPSTSGNNSAPSKRKRMPKPPSVGSIAPKKLKASKSHLQGDLSVPSSAIAGTSLNMVVNTVDIHQQDGINSRIAGISQSEEILETMDEDCRPLISFLPNKGKGRRRKPDKNGQGIVEKMKMTPLLLSGGENSIGQTGDQNKLRLVECSNSQVSSTGNSLSKVLLTAGTPRRGRPPKSRTEGVHSEKIPKTMDGEDATLASLSKKAKRRSRPCLSRAEENPETMFRDDAPLASLLNNKTQRRLRSGTMY